MMNGKYVFDANSGVWINKNHKGFSYSDGEAVENYIFEALKTSKDVSCSSDELVSKIKDWPSEYHLSPARHYSLIPLHIKPSMKILELGCGLGAITRYLGEIGVDVMAVEGSFRRAKIARERCRGLNNVNIVCDNFKEFEIEDQFDVVTLIGVLEYSPQFLGGADPLLECIKISQKHLKPDGSLVIAIENRLGLKYFNGCTEDHTGGMFDSLHDHYLPGTVQTLGYEEIKKKIFQCGFTSIQFLFPFPDYKLPTLMINEDYLKHEKINFASLIGQTTSRDYSGQRHRFFSERLVWSSIEKNELIPHLSNSFLIIANLSEREKKFDTNSWIAKIFSNYSRRACFRTETTIFKDEEAGKIFVKKERMYPHLPAVFGPLRFNDRIEKDYIYGSLFSDEIAGVFLQADVYEKYIQKLREYKDFIIELNRKKAALSSHSHFEGELIDCIPSNIVRKNDHSLHYIDNEWIMDEKVPLNYILLRGILNDLMLKVDYINSMIPFSQFSTLKELLSYIFEKLGTPLSSDDLKYYCYKEAMIQAQVGINHSIESLKNEFESWFNLLLRDVFNIHCRLPVWENFKYQIKELVNKIHQLQSICNLPSKGDRSTEKKDQRLSQIEPEHSLTKQQFHSLDPKEAVENIVQLRYEAIQSMIQSGREDEAISALEKFIVLSPAHSLAHDDLGALYFHRGDKRRALEHFIQSLKTDPENLNAMKNMADLQNELGQPEEALQLYQTLLADQPMDVEALLGMGHVCLQTGRSEDAKCFYAKVLEIEPENDSAKQGLETLSKRSPDFPISEETDHLNQGVDLTDQDQKLTSIIILAHNQLEYTKKCLDSLFYHTNEPFELILVDNGSTDKTPEYLEGLRIWGQTVGGWRLKVGEEGEIEEKRFEEKGAKKSKRAEKHFACKRFKVIRNEKNLGFAVGNNQGMAEAKGDYLLLMNNDVVVTPGWLERLIAVAEREPKIGIVGPMSNYVFGPQWVEKVSYDTTTLAGINSFAESFAQRYSGQAKPFWRVVGFCMLIKRAVVEKIGGLDSRYGLGNFEDDDFSIRARLAGFESWIAEDCFVHHFGSRTFAGSGIDYRESLHKNWEIFKRKWGLPPYLKYRAPYDMSEILRQGFIPPRHYCPLKTKEDSVLRGEELFQSGDVEGAKDLFNRFLQEDPKNVDCLNNLGVIAYQEGEIDQAMTYFNRGLALEPDHLDAIENLGQCLVTKGAYLEAIDCFEKALKLKPDHLPFLNSLGNCLIQTGDFLMAEEIYHRSLRLDGAQTNIREILAGLKTLKSMGTERRAVL